MNQYSELVPPPRKSGEFEFDNNKQDETPSRYPGTDPCVWLPKATQGRSTTDVPHVGFNPSSIDFRPSAALNTSIHLGRLFLIRHGQDTDNAHGILNGRRDEPLTDIGVAQAYEVAAKIKTVGITFDKVYISPLQKAQHTAKIVASYLNITDTEMAPELIERDFGSMTGRKVSEIVDLCSPDILQTENVTYFLSPDGAETFPQLLSRAKILLSQIIENHRTDNILLVTHGDFGKMLYSAYYDLYWIDVLSMFHFGNSDLLELSPNSAAKDTHIHRTTQYNF